MPLSSALARHCDPSLSCDIRRALAGFGWTPKKHHLRKASLICLHEGAHAGLHLLAKGRIKIVRFSDSGRVMILDLLEAGDVFGEMSLVIHAAEPTYAEALEDAEIETIPKLVFERLLKGRPGLALAMARLIAERRRKIEQRLETQIFERVPTRLAQQLLELAHRYGVAEREGTRLGLPLSQQDLANLIGASREIVSLTLSDFKRRGLIAMDGRRLIVYRSRLREALV